MTAITSFPEDNICYELRELCTSLGFQFESSTDTVQLLQQSYAFVDQAELELQQYRDQNAELQEQIETSKRQLAELAKVVADLGEIVAMIQCQLKRARVEDAMDRERMMEAMKVALGGAATPEVLDRAEKKLQDL